MGERVRAGGETGDGRVNDGGVGGDEVGFGRGDLEGRANGVGQALAEGRLPDPDEEGAGPRVRNLVVVEKFFVAGVEVVADVDFAVVVVDLHRRQLDDEDLPELGLGAPEEDSDPSDGGGGEEPAGGAGEEIGGREPDHGEGVGDEAEYQGVDVAGRGRRAAGAAGVGGGDELEPDPDAETEDEVAEGAGRGGERAGREDDARDKPSPG